MEKMTDLQERDDTQVLQPSFVNVDASDWQQKLPVLSGQQVVLRELRISDATSLFALLTARDVARFISPPPSTVAGFERFIAWTFKPRTAGTSVCFAVTLKDFEDPAVSRPEIRALMDRIDLSEDERQEGILVGLDHGTV